MAVSPATRKEGTTEHFGQQGKGGLSRRGTAAAFRVRGAPRLGGALWGVGGGGGPRPVAHLSLHRPPRAVEIHVLLPRFLPVTFRLDVVDLPERSESSTERPLRRLAAPAPCGCAWAPSSQGGGALPHPHGPALAPTRWGAVRYRGYSDARPSRAREVSVLCCQRPGSSQGRALRGCGQRRRQGAACARVRVLTRPGIVAHPGVIMRPGVLTRPGVVTCPGVVAHSGVATRVCFSPWIRHVKWPGRRCH